jgi:hypothetical protein
LSTHLRLGLCSGIFPSDFPTNILYAVFSPHSCYTPCPSHHPWLDHSNYTWRKSSSLRSFLQLPITSSLFDPNILLSTLFSNTLSLCSSLNVRDQYSQT